MRIRRMLGALLATSLAGATLTVAAGTTAPAQAAAPVQTRIVSGADGRAAVAPYSKPVQFGDTLSISVNVEAYVDGGWEQVYNGSVKVTEKVNGVKRKPVVAKADSAYVYDSRKAQGNATYTVSYSGGTGGYPEVQYAPVTKSFKISKVQRAVEGSGISGRKTGLKGKISPGAKKKFTVYKKVGKKFRKFKTARTNKKGRFKVVLPAPRKSGAQFNWKFVFPGAKRFSQTVVTGYTRRY